MNHILDPKYTVKRRPHGWVVMYFNHETGRPTAKSAHPTKAEAEAAAAALTRNP